MPYAFSVDETEIVNDLRVDIIEGLKRSTEDTITILYRPQAVFRVRAVSRCTASLAGRYGNGVVFCALGGHDVLVRC